MVVVIKIVLLDLSKVFVLSVRWPYGGPQKCIALFTTYFLPPQFLHDHNSNVLSGGEWVLDTRFFFFFNHLRKEAHHRNFIKYLSVSLALHATLSDSFGLELRRVREDVWKLELLYRREKKDTCISLTYGL